MGQKTEFTFEVEETITLKQGGKLVTEFCPKCGEMTEMVAPEVIALATRITEREIFRLIENGQVYFIENDRVYACTRCIQFPAVEIRPMVVDGSEKLTK